MDRIREAVKEADVTIVLGFAERDGASLYIAQATILPDGRIANHRRKIKVGRFALLFSMKYSLTVSSSLRTTKRPSSATAVPSPSTTSCRRPTADWDPSTAGSTFSPGLRRTSTLSTRRSSSAAGGLPSLLAPADRRISLAARHPAA